MRILDNLFGPHSRNLERALDRTTTRHTLLSENLANVNTPGYKRQDIDFGMTLEQEMGRGRSGDTSGAHKTDRGSIRVDGSSVDLETEVAALAETELRYQMLTELSARYFRGLENVIREGR
ncbi:MAG: flagellar basal body rod protein FlgB [Methanoregulaceae archaeon]|nr:flagellar basal body rod protein FlgB [Methanoregulaceae archaeon]